MRCARCSFDNPERMKFCGRCGTRLGTGCPGCGAEIVPGFQFCGECGHPLASPPAAEVPAAERGAPAPPPAGGGATQSYTPPHLADEVLRSQSSIEGEHKQVTVLFCDLVGSTALADRLGPETMHFLLSRFFELALEEIHRYEGTVNQFLGDGFMALFGAPVAHEDHAPRAVLAALGLQRLMADHRQELGGEEGVELTIRMGLNTGPAVVGGIGDRLRMDYTAVGDTTNLASRLEHEAEPGTILVSESTARQVRGYVELEPLAPRKVKGKAHPVEAFRVVGRSSRPSALRVLGGRTLSPFVGRERELAILEELLGQAASGEGQVVSLAGEAGSGKSRLLYELRRRSQERCAAWLAGRCQSYASGVPYLPLLDMLRGAWGLPESNGGAALRARVAAGLESAGMDPAADLPYFLHLLGMTDGTEPLSSLSSQALQARTFARLRQMIAGAGEGGLVVLEIEDLHWIDHTSEDFLASLVEALPGSRLLLLLTHRSGYQPPWAARSRATQIAVQRLSDGDSRGIVDAFLDRSPLPEERTRWIVERAEGNPFFLEELTRSLLEDGDAERQVPDTIQGVVLARIDRLPEDHKRLLQAASVLGREVPAELLEAIWEGPVEAAPLLADLRRWEFLYETLSAERPTYLFQHGLIQETVYRTLLAGRRRALHAAAGRALERLYAGHLEDAYDSLAYHFPEAGDAGKAVEYLARFAERAASRHAHAEAARALSTALEHAALLEGEERDRRSLELAFRLASSLLPLARFPETLEVLKARQDELERLGDPAFAGPYHFWLAHTHSYLGEPQEAARHAELSIAAARAANDPGTEGRACYVLSRDAFWSGEFTQGIRWGVAAVELLEGCGDLWWSGQAHWVAGFHHYVLGELESAFASMRRAREIWEALQDSRLDPSWSSGYFHASLGSWERGIEECRGGMERSQDPLNTAVALGFLGYSYLEKGELEEAAGALERSVARLEAAGMLQLCGWFSAFLGEVYLRQGRAEEGRRRALEGLRATEASHFRYGTGLAQRALGRVAAQQGQAGEAARWFGEALATFTRLEVPFEAARTYLDLAELAHGRGEAEEAAESLEEAHRRFAALGATLYEERALAMAVRFGTALPDDDAVDLAAGGGAPKDDPNPHRS